ncbi:hypothetical protein ACFLQ6_10625 [Thermoproteota archaeon]
MTSKRVWTRAGSTGLSAVEAFPVFCNYHGEAFYPSDTLFMYTCCCHTYPPVRDSLSEY